MSRSPLVRAAAALAAVVVTWMLLTVSCSLNAGIA